ncbi:MAG: segregation and condensation protein A [Terriglobales bacterium]
MSDPHSHNPTTREAEASQSAYSVQIGTVYAGPLDLLLDLIRKQDIDIYDIPISRLTQQYLAYLERMEEVDVEVAAEFLLMAATLIQIKSKLLLPPDPQLPGEPPAGDPRDELVRRLLEYENFKRAAEMLHQKQQLEDASWSHPGIEEFADAEGTEAELAVGVHDLVRTFQQVLERAKERPRLEIMRDDVSVRDMIDHLCRLLRANDAPIKLRALFESAPGRSALVATFLALLELVRLNAVVLRQERMFGEIVLKKHAQFEQAFASMTEGTPPEPDYR